MGLISFAITYFPKQTAKIALKATKAVSKKIAEKALIETAEVVNNIEDNKHNRKQ